MNLPLLTVIVPICNGQKYLAETLDSILASTYKNLEILLLDDGSTDNSAGLCRAYCRRDSRFRYSYETNHGIVYTRNRGLRLASGEYVCFCDQDDIVESSMYAELIHKNLSEGSQMALCSTGRLINGQKSSYETLGEGTYRGDDILAQYLYPILFRGYDVDFAAKNVYLYGTVWKCVFQKKFLTDNSIRFRRYVNYEDDWIFMTEALCLAGCVSSVKKIGYYWRMDSASTSHSPSFHASLFKQMAQFDKDCTAYLGSRIANQEIMGKYRQILYCEHYIDIIKNYSAIKKMPAEIRETQKKPYKKQAKKYLLETDYRYQITMLKNLKNSAFRRKAVGFSLKYFGFGGACIASGIVDFLENTLTGSKHVAALERRLKQK